MLDEATLEHKVHHYDGTTEIIAGGHSQDTWRAVTPQCDPLVAQASWTDELVVASLGEIVHARSGDKGGDANLGVWVRDFQAWEWLKSTLTVDELRRLLPATRELAIERYELPKLGAINFVLRGLLGTGATSTLRLDSQARRSVNGCVRRSTKVPRSLVKPWEGTDERH